MSRPSPDMVLPAQHTSAFGIILPTINGELVDDFRLLGDPCVLALLGIGGVPEEVIPRLSPYARVVLTELRSEIARHLYCKGPRPSAIISESAEAVNAGGGGWWPMQAGPYDVTDGKLPESIYTLWPAALWGLYIIQAGCQRMALARKGLEKFRMMAAADAAQTVCDVMGAEVGEPYAAGRRRPSAKELGDAWHDFALMVAWVPGLQVLPLMLVKDDLPALLSERVSPRRRPKLDQMGEEP